MLHKARDAYKDFNEFQQPEQIDLENMRNENNL